MTLWSPDLSQRPGPRYRALAAAIAEAIASGALAPGDRLPTHRALAERLGVTVGTVTRGYAEAERQGLVNARVGSGTFVRSPATEAVWRFGITECRSDVAVIDFSLSLPVPAQRERMLAEALRAVADDPGALRDALVYLPETGLPRHREVLTDWLAGWGTRLDPDECVITLGGLHAVNLALRAVARPGDLICSAALTYPGLIAAARSQGLRHVGLPLDSEGIDADAFARLCEQQAPRALYCVPNQNNPTTVCMTADRRAAILEVARRNDVTIIEDEVHLVTEAERPANLVELDPDRVLYVSGCSKILAGGLRVGILRSPGPLYARVGAALRSHCWMPPPLNAEVACRWIESGTAAELARWQRHEVGERQALAAEMLRGFEFDARPYGFNLWLQLPEPWRALELVAACERAGVRLTSGEPFAVGRCAVPQAVRLCLSSPPTRDAVREGLGIVRGLLEGQPGAVSGTV